MMKKLVLLMTVAAIGSEAYAASTGYAPRNYGGARNGYADSEPEEQDFREERRIHQGRQQFLMAELQAKAQEKARLPELQQEQLRQRQEEQEELRAQQQRAVRAELRQGPRFKAVREEEQDQRYAAPAGRYSAESERERAIREQEEEELRAARADAQRRKILADRARQAEEDRMLEEQENQRPSRYNQPCYPSLF